MTKPLSRSPAFIKTTMTIAGHCPLENKRPSNSPFGMNAELESHVCPLFKNNASKNSGAQPPSSRSPATADQACLYVWYVPDRAYPHTVIKLHHPPSFLFHEKNLAFLYANAYDFLQKSLSTVISLNLQTGPSGATYVPNKGVKRNMGRKGSQINTIRACTATTQS